jgi:hypothetical protein
MEPRTLAEGARLLHIGFRKCGTTALQTALRRARVPLAALGVVYPGENGNQTAAALAVTGRTHGWVALGATPQPRQKWDELVEEVDAVGPPQRAIISSEFFDVADEDTIRTVVAGLGGDRTHVVVTARPLAKILPSAWQQQVKVGLRTSYGEWLRHVLEGHDGNKTHRTFWERHDQAAVISRWAGVVGPERVTLVVLDESDRLLPFRSFETLLGLPRGTLEELPDAANRSMTGAEAELIRRINVEIFAADISWDEYSRWIRRGAALRMISRRTPEPQEPRTQTPRWALERATELSEGFLSRIEGLGLEVVGDLSGLAAAPDLSGPDVIAANPELVPIDAAVEAVIGSGFSTRERRKPNPPPVAAPAGPPASQLSAAELSSLLARRIRKRARRSWRRARRRLLDKE